MDADPHFNEYPPEEEFVKGPDWEPGRIPPKILSPEYTGSSSDTSIDTQAARAMQAVSFSANTESPDRVAASMSGGGDTWKVELTPFPGLTQQFALQMEREIQKQIKEQSRKLVQEVLQRSANRIMPPTALEAARASLSQCFQKVMTTDQTKPVEQPKVKAKEAPAQYSQVDPFAEINPPPSGVLTGGRSDQPSRGRMTQHSEQPRSDYPAEEKKRRSTSCPQGEAEPKRGRSGGKEPSWDTSNVGARQSDKARSQPAGGPEVPEPTAKVKSVVKKVRISMPEFEDLEDLGPAAWS